jgi:aerobic carbon-monoxide dehydrogenase medium subunit
MLPASFDYHRPTSLDQALTLLAELGEDARLLAGGHSLIPAMKFRLAQPSALVDLGGVSELRRIEERDGQIAIGAMATHGSLESSPLLASKCPLFPDAARQIGDLQVRNMGTIGGSLAHADPAADWPAVVLALDAALEAVSRGGRRTIPADQFFVDMLQTALRPGEILTRIDIADWGTTAAYVKTEQKASGFALCGVAAVVDARTRRVRVGVTGVAPVPYRALAVERALNDQTLTIDLIKSAAAAAAEGVTPLGDIHASAEYRAHLAAVNTTKALIEAARLRPVG